MASRQARAKELARAWNLAVQDGLQHQLGSLLPDPNNTARLMEYVEKKQVSAGQTLIRQGDPADALYFIESGFATAHLELPDGRRSRLRTMCCGTIIGEVGLYLGAARTATILATEPTTVSVSVPIQFGEWSTKTQISRLGYKSGSRGCWRNVLRRTTTHSPR